MNLEKARLAIRDRWAFAIDTVTDAAHREIEALPWDKLLLMKGKSHLIMLSHQLHKRCSMIGTMFNDWDYTMIETIKYIVYFEGLLAETMMDVDKFRMWDQTYYDLLHPCSRGRGREGRGRGRGRKDVDVELETLEDGLVKLKISPAKRPERFERRRESRAPKVKNLPCFTTPPWTLLTHLKMNAFISTQSSKLFTRNHI